jgi:hypothetical protein
MILGGLWHGAAINYVVWGAYHGALLIVAKSSFAARINEVVPKNSVVESFRIIGFFVLTCFGWLMFRLNDSLSQELFFSALRNDNWLYTSLTDTKLLYCFIFSVPVIGFHIFQNLKGEFRIWRHWNLCALMLFDLALLYSIILFGSPETEEFIYFQF